LGGTLVLVKKYSRVKSNPVRDYMWVEKCNVVKKIPIGDDIFAEYSMLVKNIPALKVIPLGIICG